MNLIQWVYCQERLFWSDMILNIALIIVGFPGGSVVKNPSANAGVVGLILELGRSPGEGNGNLL